MKKLKNQTPIRFCAHCGLRYERATVINLYGKDFLVQFCSAYCAGKAQEKQKAATV